jgi:hypothetical protein
MALDCLTDFIGLAGCQSSEPESGLYINSLPGITLKRVDSLADSEQITYVGVWKDVQQRAILRFRTQLMVQLNKCYQINERATVECIACEYKDLLSTALWYLIGHELMIENIFSDRINRYTTIDREEAKELRDYYMLEFDKEIQAAIQGIDVENSDCVNNETDCPLQQNGAVHFRESGM